MGGLLIAAAVAGTAVSIDQQREAAKDQKRARRTQERLQQAKHRRQRRQQIREAQRARSESIAQAQALGMSVGSAKSSAVGQATGSIQSQLAGNLSFLDQAQELTQQTSIFEQRAADHMGRAGIASAVSGLALQGASLYNPKPKPKTKDTGVNLGARAIDITDYGRLS